MTNFCYVLANGSKTYVGYTTDPEQRLRKHNCEMSGGARYTTTYCIATGSKWHFIMIIQGITDLTKPEALSLEWWLKHPDGRRRTSSVYRGSRGKILAAKHVLGNDRFKHHSFIVYINQDYKAEFEHIMGCAPNNVNLHLL